jgi:predicted transcriptional regulator
MDNLHSNLRFDGSLWCNLDVALRNLDRLFRKAICPSEVTTIEWYILRSLYGRDGQHASELAQAVGRAATSFTPNLDKLENRGLVERRPDPADRRSPHLPHRKGEAQRSRSRVRKRSTRNCGGYFDQDYEVFQISWPRCNRQSLE